MVGISVHFPFALGFRLLVRKLTRRYVCHPQQGQPLRTGAQTELSGGIRCHGEESGPLATCVRGRCRSRSAYKCPINARAKLLAAHRAPGFTLKIDCQFFRARPETICNVAQMPSRCVTSLRELFPLGRQHGIKEGLENFEYFSHA